MPFDFLGRPFYDSGQFWFSNWFQPKIVISASRIYWRELVLTLPVQSCRNWTGCFSNCFRIAIHNYYFTLLFITPSLNLEVKIEKLRLRLRKISSHFFRIWIKRKRFFYLIFEFSFSVKTQTVKWNETESLILVCTAQHKTSIEFSQFVQSKITNRSETTNEKNQIKKRAKIQKSKINFNF